MFLQNIFWNLMQTEEQGSISPCVKNESFIYLLQTVF